LFFLEFLFHFLCHCLFSSKHLLIMKFFATFHDFKLMKTKRFRPTWVFWRSMKSSCIDWVCFWMTHFSWRSLQNKCVKFFIIELNAYYSTPHRNPNMWISKLFLVDFFFCFVNLSWTMQRWSILTPLTPLLLWIMCIPSTKSIVGATLGTICVLLIVSIPSTT
jgi:hypothetical protein